MVARDTVRDVDIDAKRCPDCGHGFGLDAAFCPFDGTRLTKTTWNPTRDPRCGTVVQGRYEVIEPLGEGGMGTVYKVQHMKLNRPFAMKVLRKDLATDGDLAKRFVQEARATAAIQHPSVVGITDFGELEDGTPYFMMELLVGETLATRIRARGPLSPSDAIGVATRVADALAASHAANVIHRDLKPENVYLVGKAAGKEATDEIRIVDFGAAKIVGASKMTRPGVVFGTPYYMSPEQASGQAVDGRADVYSLGVLLYEMVTGSVPFEADTYMGVLTKHMFAEPGRPSERVPAGIQLGVLEDVVLRALAKDPDARYQSMAEFSSALTEAGSNTKSAAPAPPPRVTERIATLQRPLSTADRIQRSVDARVREEKSRSRRTIVIAVCAAATTLLLCAAAVTLWDDREARRPLPAPAVAALAASGGGAVVEPGSASGEPASGAASASASASASATASASASGPPAAVATAGAPAVTKAPRPPPARSSATVVSPPPGPASDDFDPWRKKKQD